MKTAVRHIKAWTRAEFRTDVFEKVYYLVAITTLLTLFCLAMTTLRPAPHIKNYSYTSAAIGGDVCHEGYRNTCGMILSKCDSGEGVEYFCVSNVKIELSKEDSLKKENSNEISK